MVEHSTAAESAIDRVFHALASATRRQILRHASERPHTVSELAARFDMSLAAVSKHVHVLEEARLLEQTQEGRVRWCHGRPEGIARAQRTLEELAAYWSRRLDALEGLLAESERMPQKPQRRKRARR